MGKVFITGEVVFYMITFNETRSIELMNARQLFPCLFLGNKMNE